MRSMVRGLLWAHLWSLHIILHRCITELGAYRHLATGSFTLGSIARYLRVGSTLMNNLDT